MQSDNNGFDSLLEGQKQLIRLALFVLEFAEVERQAIGALTTIGNISEKFLKAALSGTRVKEVINIIKKLLATNPEDARNKIYDEIARHFSPINDARNMILHYGMHVGGLAGFHATNYQRSPNPQFIPLSTKILADMTEDLKKIIAMIIVSHLQQDSRYEDSWAGDQLLVSRQPWLYKPPPQDFQKKKEDQKSQPKVRKQKPQR